MAFEEELQLEKDTFKRKKLGKCGKCRFNNYNKFNGDVSRSRYDEEYCLVKERRLYKASPVDFISMAFCKHFKPSINTTEKE